MKQAANLTLLRVYVRLQMLTEFSCLGGGSLYITFNRIDRLQRRTRQDVDQNVLEYLYSYSGTTAVFCDELAWIILLLKEAGEVQLRCYCTPAPRVDA
jgi:hypothetical protein